jgi:ABC-type nickel/cobalt efflux system permease component RcnA
MNRQKPTLKHREPVTFISSLEGGAKALVLAVMSLALAFNWINWTDEQNAAVLAVIAAVFVLISAVCSVILRRKVTPTRLPRTNAGAPLIEVTAEN